VIVAGGTSDAPMDSIRTADAPDDPADIAARLRDAQLPGAPAPGPVARPH
jgi:hypothetical protein